MLTKIKNLFLPVLFAGLIIFTACPLEDDTTPPSNVRNISFKAAETSIFVTFDEPDDTDYSHTTITAFLDDQEVKSIKLSKGTRSGNISGLTAGTEYTIVFYTQDNSGNKSEEITKTFSTLNEKDETPPGKIKSIVTEAGNTDFIRFTVTPPEDEDLAYVTVKLLDSEEKVLGTKKVCMDKKAGGGTFTNLTPDTSYTFEITATDTTGNVSEPEYFKVKTDAEIDKTPPEEVSDLKITYTSTSLSVTFTHPEDEDYKMTRIVLLKNGKTEAREFILKDNDASWTYRLVKDTEYKIIIQTCDENGNYSSGLTKTFKAADEEKKGELEIVIS